MKRDAANGRLMASASRPIALAVPAFLMSMGVAAAQQATPTAQKVASNDTGAPSSHVEEVIVTARKREESVQRVPIAITAFTGQLKQADVRNLSDLVAYTPNVRIDSYAQRAGAADITIRGISPSRLDDNSIDSPIGVLIDGVYLGTLVGQLIDNFDLTRIEVLRGPQGTLFGRNTVGGALNVIRTEPTGDWGAKVSYTTGSWDDQEFRGVFNAPVIKDILALKLYLFSANRDGYIHNTFLNINEPQRDYKNFGGSLKLTPNDKFKAVFTFDKYEDRSEAGTFLTNYNTGGRRSWSSADAERYQCAGHGIGRRRPDGRHLSSQPRPISDTGLNPASECSCPNELGDPQHDFNQQSPAGRCTDLGLYTEHGL